jgi:NADPH:quinone reductase-like Zn-dependent oxidoreductase
MRVLQYRKYGGLDVLELADAPAREPRGTDVEVRVVRAALNPKDALFRKGRFRAVSGRSFPKRCGVDFAGEVTRSSSPDFRAGDRVFGALQEWRYLRGTLAERVIAHENELAKLPDRVSFDDGAAFALAGLTSLQALRDLGRVTPGGHVLVNGASGGVGTAAIQIAKRLGARVSTRSSEGNRALCLELGADEAFAYDEPAFAAGRGYECVYDVYGNLRAVEVRASCARRAVFVSTVPSLPRIARDLLTRRSAFVQRLVVVRPNRADLELLAGWLERGEVRAIVDSRFPLDRFEDAFRVLETRHARGKIVVEVG